MKRINFTTLLYAIIVLIVLSCNGISKIATNEVAVCCLDNEDKSVDNQLDTTQVLKARDMSIIQGNHVEYRKFHNEYQESLLSESGADMKRDAFFYSFIMAECYSDTLAAFDFAEIFEDCDVEKDSIGEQRYLRYLNMAFNSNMPLFSYLAARKLYKIYNDGTQWVRRDKMKATYYDKFCDSIAPSIFR